MRVLSWHAHLPGGRPKGLPYSNLEELVGRGLAPAALEVSTPCKARSPGCAAPSTDGRPRGSPLQGCKNACKARKPRAAQCAAPTEIGKRLRIRRPPEPHLSPTHAKGARNKKSFRFPIFVYKSRRRRPPTQSPAKRVCVGEDTRPRASVSERNRPKGGSWRGDGARERA